MTDQKLPELAPGSEWRVDYVVDASDHDIETHGPMLHVSSINGATICHTKDVLAVIRHANLDPLAIAAKELVEMMRGGHIAIDCEPEDFSRYAAVLNRLEVLL